ncbi:hypothetical protein P4O66_000333 [Electrophorus voltai]|uniref:PH domain-containing protein n=1 Tax=Electrophorus voltai TaxID=2609070 RepID=A0AAD8ZKI0_9TELE|nr:hypothetical protein P4O66_000333 [Electrophorus voltai]
MHLYTGRLCSGSCYLQAQQALSCHALVTAQLLRVVFTAWVLKRWRLNWCDLWIDGSLMFYKTDSRSDYETRVRLKSTCMNVKHGLECAGASPPENQPRENLLVVYLRDGSTMHLCANSEDEAMAWKLSIMEAKRNPFFFYDPYDDTYQSAFIDSHNAVCITPGGGNGGIKRTKKKRIQSFTF